MQRKVQILIIFLIAYFITATIASIASLLLYLKLGSNPYETLIAIMLGYFLIPAIERLMGRTRV